MKSKDQILQEYDKIQDLAEKYSLETTFQRLLLEILTEGVLALIDIRDHLTGKKPSEPQTSEKEAEKKAPPADRPVQKKVEGEKYDPNGPPTDKQWWRLDQIQEQVSKNRWRQFLDDAKVTLENELTLTKASKIIEEVTKRKE